MKTFDYKIETDGFKAEGQIDSESKEAAEAMLRRQYSQVKKAPFIASNPVEIRSLELEESTANPVAQ